MRAVQVAAMKMATYRTGTGMYLYHAERRRQYYGIRVPVPDMYNGTHQVRRPTFMASESAVAMGVVSVYLLCIRFKLMYHTIQKATSTTNSHP